MPPTSAATSAGAPGTAGTAPPPSGGGAVEVLANPRADRVRAVARLAQRPARQRARAFLAEGPQAVREALGGGWGGRVHEVYLTEAADQRHPELATAARSTGVRLRWCTPAVMAALSSTPAPQGVLAVCDLLGTALEPALDAAAARPAPLVAVLAGVSDPGNAGTVLRSADAAGAGAVVLAAGSVDAHNPKCVRATAGSLFHVDVVEDVPLAAALAGARARGLVVLAADGGASSVDLDDLLDDAEEGRGPLAGGVAWLFGNEAHGLAGVAPGLADLRVAVPMPGAAESLNLAAAAAVCLFATARAQHRATGAQRRAAESPGRPAPGTPAARAPEPSGDTGAVTRSSWTPLAEPGA